MSEGTAVGTRPLPSTLDPAVWIALLIGSLFLLGLVIATATALTLVFRRAGEEPWKAWVPVLNVVVILRMGAVSPWWLLLGVVPPAAVVPVLVACHRVGRAFGRRPAFTLLAVLAFPVWATVLGWSGAVWRPVNAPSVFGAGGPAPGRAPASVARPRAGGGFPSVLPRRGPGAGAHTAAAGHDGAVVAWQVSPRRTPALAMASADAPMEGESSPSSGEDVWAPRAVPEGGVRERSVEDSLEASAVASAPRPALPRSARAAVAAAATAQHSAWVLHVDEQSAIAVTSDTVLLGRGPASPRQHPVVQLVEIPEPRRTVSKTHARLERRGSTWTVTDLDSANGVVLVDGTGGQSRISEPTILGADTTILLGDARVRLRAQRA